MDLHLSLLLIFRGAPFAVFARGVFDFAVAFADVRAVSFLPLPLPFPQSQISNELIS
jgi:hypothetical protein